MKNREQLIKDYVLASVGNMDIGTMEVFIQDTLIGNLSEYTDEQLVTEIADHYPELLKDN